MGRDKNWSPYQTVGDVIWLALTDRDDTPPVNQKLKKPKEQKMEEQQPAEQKKKVKDVQR